MIVNDIKKRAQLLMLANGNPLLALQYYEQGVLEVYSDCIDKLLSLKAGSGSLVKQAEELQKSDVSLWLDIFQKLIWLLIQSAQGKKDLQESNLQILEPIVNKKGFSQKAFIMLEEVQQAIKETQGPSNPNSQLLIESLLIRWQALVR